MKFLDGLYMRTEKRVYEGRCAMGFAGCWLDSWIPSGLSGREFLVCRTKRSHEAAELMVSLFQLTLLYTGDMFIVPISGCTNAKQCQ